ncbi:MAG: SGNH/GDSL hydrolase family protein [Clostridia bacterium]|nr:SGNH/GDSL hydrolase family protein [Clostridia bacterium]
MRLTFEQIKSVAFGAVCVEQAEDGIHFEKLTKKQISAFADFRASFRERALTTTGVRLDFCTNSKHLAFSTSRGRKFEVYIDDLLCRQFDCDELREAGQCAEIELVSPIRPEADTVRVTLIFPSHTVGVLEYLELDDGATVEPHRFDCRMLFIGDSITQGWDSKYDSFSYAWRVTRFFNAESIIQGIGGAYYHETTFDTLAFDPDTVIVSLGTNDFATYKTIDEMRQHVTAHLDLIAEAYKDTKVFAISPIWRADTEGRAIGSFEDVRRMLIEEIEKHGLIHIDGLSLVPHAAEFMADQRLHPNDLGFSLYAENLIAQMIKK